MYWRAFFEKEKNTFAFNYTNDEGVTALKLSIKELETYIKINKEFDKIGRRMLDTWKLSLEEETSKEIKIEITRTWK